VHPSETSETEFGHPVAVAACGTAPGSEVLERWGRPLLIFPGVGGTAAPGLFKGAGVNLSGTAFGGRAFTGTGKQASGAHVIFKRKESLCLGSGFTLAIFAFCFQRIRHVWTFEDRAHAELRHRGDVFQRFSISAHRAGSSPLPPWLAHSRKLGLVA
jgi:hypothetical protein